MRLLRAGHGSSGMIARDDGKHEATYFGHRHLLCGVKGMERCGFWERVPVDPQSGVCTFPYMELIKFPLRCSGRVSSQKSVDGCIFFKEQSAGMLHAGEKLAERTLQ